MTKALLFDLDGTLVDTAPSLIGMVNVMLREQNHPLLAFAQARNLVSRGARPLLQRGFGRQYENNNRDALFTRLLEVYRDATHEESSLFIDLDALLRSYSHPMLWGIVTNKLTTMTEQLLDTLPLPGAPNCVVCGDTLEVKKPDPAPLLHAASQLGVAAADCIYVGDDERDVIAGKAAGMPTVLATWGYIPPGTDYLAWNADAIAAHPSQLNSVLHELTDQTPRRRSAS